MSPERSSGPDQPSAGSTGLFSELLRFGPHAGAHRVAVRAGVSVLVPLLLLWATDHTHWSIYAAFGAFTSLYGRTSCVRWWRCSVRSSPTLRGGTLPAPCS